MRDKFMGVDSNDLDFVIGGIELEELYTSLKAFSPSREGLIKGVTMQTLHNSQEFKSGKKTLTKAN